jgi:hypothetical protein
MMVRISQDMTRYGSPFSQLETIIVKNKRDWVSALENQKAVYLGLAEQAAKA